jgi:glutamine---fructose-6-phosphate transaminase (isomerizing)
MNTTTRSITEQFPYWSEAAAPDLQLRTDQQHVLVGCGTSYYLAQSVAAALNEAGVPALAVPGSEWLIRPEAYLTALSHPHVIAFSRSGESTETVQAAIRSRAAGLHVTALTCEALSSLAKNADTVLFSKTHPEEGIVMTSSASLMLLGGLRLAGLKVGETEIQAAQTLLEQVQPRLVAAIAGKSHFVFLGGGQLYGVAQEGALKLQEMSLSYTQAYHPMEYRHGPVSLVDDQTLIVLLYHPGTPAEEAKLAQELSSKGARVLGLGGPGDLSFDVEGDANLRALTVLPTLQMLGECVAQAKGLDSVAPRWLTKVVTLA